MKLYDRYISGQTEQVYNDILAMGKEAFSHACKDDVDKVLTELFTRVAYNLDIIYAELKSINYLFRTESGSLAVQVHVGPPMRVAYRNIFLKKL